MSPVSLSGSTMEIVSHLVVEATDSPIDLSWARDHLKSIVNEDDDLILSWIQAAASYFKEYTGRPILTETYEAWIDAFPMEAKIELPNPPLVEVLSVKYIDSTGTLVDWGEGSPVTPLWREHIPSGLYARRAWIEPLISLNWPTVSSLDQSAAVRIQYRAGYAETAADVPSMIKTILLQMVGTLDRFRTDVYVSEGGNITKLPFGAEQMMAAFKYTALPSQVLHRL
jgi:hypothetical protein